MVDLQNKLYQKILYPGIILSFFLISSIGLCGDETNYTAGQSSAYRVDSVELNMHYIPGGLTFPTDHDSATIGSPEAANAYWIAETDVTYELWLTVYSWATTTAPNKYVFSHKGYMGSDNSGSNQQPVTSISWRDAMIWCNALTEYYYGNSTNCVYCMDTTYTTPIRNVDKSQTITTTTPGSEDNPYVNPTAKGFRLPSSNEWELAARYINGTTWNPGNHISGDIFKNIFSSKFNNYAWYSNNSGGITHIVGTTGSSTPTIPRTGKANALGLYDMSGNVWQWCFDWHPSHIGSRRVERGGSWHYDSFHLQIGFVDFDPPYYAYNRAGFRLVKTQ